MNDNGDNGDAEIKMISVIPIISYHCREGGFLCLKKYHCQEQTILDGSV